MADYGPILSSPKQHSARVERAIDRLSWALPVIAAGLSALGGVEALEHADRLAAILGIAGASIGAFGVLFTNLASRIRDQRLALVQAIGEIHSGALDRMDRMAPRQF